MFVKDETSKEKIIDAINSIENTLFYHSVKDFEISMKAIGMKVDILKVYDEYYSYFCTGIIDDYFLELTFYTDSPCSYVFLAIKKYTQKDTSLSINHRNDDFPALIEYNFESEIVSMSYYKNGIEFRDNNQALFISYHYDVNSRELVTYCRYFPAFFYKQENYRIYHITYTKNSINECFFCYNNNLLSLDEIISIIPDVKMFKRNQLMDLKTQLSPEHLSLIEMVLL